jgi:hypothetical protein
VQFDSSSACVGVASVRTDIEDVLVRTHVRGFTTAAVEGDGYGGERVCERSERGVRQALVERRRGGDLA